MRSAPTPLPSLLGGLLLLSAAGCGQREAAAPAVPRRPNVVLVVVDTLRADALGTLGSAYPTPHLDRLAAEGVVFSTAIAASTWTLPSVASLITSLHPSEHGLLGAAEGAEQREGFIAAPAGKQRLAEVIAILAREPAILLEPVDGVGIEHLAPDIRVPSDALAHITPRN